ncbi:uncharacterized protein [Littorina saxatilis]|uniref:Novel STAND NTPase 3 domain-containing protein n=1 Tax=Littorina saxatilis TaxID=31220 RepID=A0AAN9G6C4_9CAEN
MTDLHSDVAHDVIMDAEPFTDDRDVVNPMRAVFDGRDEAECLNDENTQVKCLLQESDPQTLNVAERATNDENVKHGKVDDVSIDVHGACTSLDQQTPTKGPASLTIGKATTVNVGENVNVTHIENNVFNQHYYGSNTSCCDSTRASYCDLQTDAEVISRDFEEAWLTHKDTEAFLRAVGILQRTGRVMLCGTPGSEKTSLGKALLYHFQGEDYMPRCIGTFCCQAREVLRERGRSIVLMDGGLGEVSLNNEKLQGCKDLLFNTINSQDSRRCLLVFTAYPHILKAVAKFESVSRNPLLDQSMVVNLQYGSPRNAVTFIPLLQRMVHDPVDGQIMAALLALTMLGTDIFPQEPAAVRKELERLGFSNISCCDLQRVSSFLAGSILEETGPGFSGRHVYDAAGLVLCRLSDPPVLLKVCDAAFLVQHVRVGDTALQSPSNMIYLAGKGKSLLMQRMHELAMAGQVQELCQHPSLGNKDFLTEFHSFCKANRGYLKQLATAKDSRHGLPLLYWSVWNSMDFTLWCLKIAEEYAKSAKCFTESVLSTALALVVFSEASDITNSKSKAFIEELVSLKFNPSSKNTLKLSLPRPNMTVTRDGDATDETVASFTPGSYCYLHNSSLPVPSSLLSMSVSEEVVSMEVPSKQWYLVLRLLSDRKRNEKDQHGNTLLHIAVESGVQEAVNLVLKSGALLKVRNKGRLTPCDVAEMRCQKRLFFMKVDNKPAPGALHRACLDGEVETVKRLLCEGCSKQDKDAENKDTPLHVASRSGQTQIVSLLLDIGADTHAKNGFKATPLHSACHGGHLNIVKLLVGRGADVNIKALCRTPLHLASWKGHDDIVDFLIKHGGDVNTRGLVGTALHEACIHLRTKVARLLLNHGAEVNSRDGWGHSPLHCACKANHTELVLLLLEHQADVHVKNERGWSPVDLAVSEGHGALANLLQNYHSRSTRARQRRYAHQATPLMLEAAV